MAERLVLTVGIVILGTAVWILWNRLSLRRVGTTTAVDPLLADIRPGVPAIVYFTTPFCQPCRWVQKPALAQLQAELGSAIQVIEVDATAKPDIADRWGVFSAPTTFILDGNRTPRHVNRGIVMLDGLKKQLDGLA